MNYDFSVFTEISNIYSFLSFLRYKSIYQKIQETQHSDFNALIRTNRAARLNLHYEPLTVFVPENKAFDNYNKDLDSSLAFYHMSYEVKTLTLLRTTNSMSTVDLDNPPLWFTKVNKDIYVNNAKILGNNSNYMSRGRNGDMGKQQVLYIIDEVLDPVIKYPKFSPNAYDLLSSIEKWDLGATKTVTKFFHKVQENNLLNVYKQTGGHTFFIPVDSGIDPHKFKMINKNIIVGHVVPHYILFTRPTEKNFAYESMANNEFVYTVVSFAEQNDTVFVRGVSNGGGGFYSEIVVPNIPVKNGVVHLISQPLGTFKRTLKPFPYLPILDKITNDPELDVFYEMGEKTGFNKIFEKEDVSFTYFIPKDSSWVETRKHDLEPTDNDLAILQRHLIVSSTPYSIEQLVSLCRANNYTDIELATQAGPLRINVLKIQDEYFIKWHKKYIKVVRPDYECTNGIIHILAGPMVHFRKTDNDEEGRPQKNCRW
ncbi:hypothetical protein NQ314_003145 [Rhamnusium bicolor]|uniref:FAS1 domain-containing protein n=1 Tax=Rhamnusium bicolor TaxID=1586634 RepID=A0AAV8ZMG7_9CUCU|nr:hypothetical protein NQ314_003145 [Rhamnusium bicolor]